MTENYRFCVINANGTYAGVPCVTYEEARELAAQQEGRRIFEIWLEDDDPDECDDWDYNEDMGFDPYMGCYSDDC